MKSGVAKTSDYVEEDARIAEQDIIAATVPDPPAPSAPRRPKRPLAIEDGSNEWEMPAVPQVAPKGIEPLLLSKKGQQLCADFQKGSCIGTYGMSRCLRDGASLHICAVCSDNRHGAHYPQERAGPKKKQAGQETKTKRRRR